MASAHSRKEMYQATRHLDGIIRDAQQHSDHADRAQLAVRALRSPHIKALEVLSRAWYAAIRMLYCYATIKTEEERHYLKLFSVTTLEEVAEQQMWNSKYYEDMNLRVVNIAAIAALHGLNWARQNPES